MILSQGSFMDFLSAFSKNHSGIHLDLYVTNTYLNLVAENMDIVIRFGPLQDSSIIAVKLGKSLRYVVAAAEYMRGRKHPADPDELREHDCVLFNARHNEADWDLISGRKKVRVRVSGNLSSRDCQSVAAFVMRGHGIGLLETGYCEQAIARGDLVRLLPRWTSTEIPVFAVYPSRKFLPPRVTAFIRALVAWKTPWWVAHRGRP
jgi:DNA-binding transcriptional LysR family regulator